MRASFVLAAAAALLLLGVAAPADALAKGDCVVDLKIATGALVGLDFSTSLKYNANYTDARGKFRSTPITVTPKSKDDTQRGAVTGKIALVFPAGTNCTFNVTNINTKDAGYNNLKAALKKGVFVGSIPTGSSYGVSIANFAGSSTTKVPNTTTTFSVSGFKVDLASASAVTLAIGASKAIKQANTYSGSATFLTTYRKKISNTISATGSFGISGQAISALDKKSAGACILTLKNAGSRSSPLPTFILQCNSWNVQFKKLVSNAVTANIGFRQSSGRNAVQFKATGELTKAYIY